MSSIAQGKLTGDAISAEFGGAISETKARAAAFRANAEQEKTLSERRDARFVRDTNRFFGAQISSFAKAGVDISGTPLLKLGIEKQLADQERQFQLLDSEFRQEQFLKGASAADAEANALKKGKKAALLGNFISTSRNVITDAFTFGASSGIGGGGQQQGIGTRRQS